jgi:hypothetical protein
MRSRSSLILPDITRPEEWRATFRGQLLPVFRALKDVVSGAVWKAVAAATAERAITRRRPALRCVKEPSFFARADSEHVRLQPPQQVSVTHGEGSQG